ncbi:efflux transporter outer membrane subunit [Pseudomonas nunensis]|uniref:Efflux transporter outer membrane subunit n=1 Tax=Pseudomonas nunensis TaxID=2961896 RepID=A0ABY5EFM7_9PSED|nr:efflux transporter outer membrane subunit [Pseudomonas nunensis]KPN87746.1 multidrug transporter [Pseudomonas nunensis]MCL5227178.1 efflux transporter outer membrane subunit [Pseudomonas nunensis]UTO14583.1 efflux transporter outer membrane subunit [Pseudomonas nunensis]
MKNLVMNAALAFVLMSVNGCSLIPQYQRPQAPMDNNWAAPVDSSTTGADRVSWQAFFHDEALRQLIGQALESNRDLQVATLNIEKARAEYRITRSDLLPSIDASGSGNAARLPGDVAPSGVTGTTHQYSVGVGFTAYELDLFGRVRSLNQQALESYFATFEVRRGVRLALIAEVASSYYQLQADQQLLAIAGQTLTSQRDSYELVHNRYSLDVATELDLSQAESTVRIAEASEARYSRAVEQDKNALVLLVGKPLPAQSFKAIELDALSVEESLQPGLPSALLAYRPDILAAEHALKAANANIGAARAAFFPNISLTASAGSASSELDQLFAGGQGAWTFIPSVSLPIFNWGRNQANLDVAKVNTSIEVANYQKVIQVAFREVSDALVARASLDAQLKAESLLVEANERSYRMAENRYEEGVDTYLNSLDAQRSLYNVQQAVVQTKLSRINNLVSLYKALGGGDGLGGLPL